MLKAGVAVPSGCKSTVTAVGAAVRDSKVPFTTLPATVILLFSGSREKQDLGLLNNFNSKAALPVGVTSRLLLVRMAPFK